MLYRGQNISLKSKTKPKKKLSCPLKLAKFYCYEYFITFPSFQCSTDMYSSTIL